MLTTEAIPCLVRFKVHKKVYELKICVDEAAGLTSLVEFFIDKIKVTITLFAITKSIFS